MLQVKSIVQTLLDALPTPSYSVQEAVSGCLSPLMQGLSSDKAYVQSLAQRLLDSALTGPDYPHRFVLRALLCHIPNSCHSLPQPACCALSHAAPAAYCLELHD